MADGWARKVELSTRGGGVGGSKTGEAKRELLGWVGRMLRWNTERV